ncbi:FecR domain-containing protein [Pseudomonas sp. 15FMM2]|uniref:FecR domain-containing protein n=1 Tax=Pseudomonas imrae TaxID=2992837 RepID=A0ACC7PCL9_9PSED
MNGASVEPKVRDAAIDWIVRTQSGVMNATDHRALEQWRQASAEHEYAWQRVLSLPLLLQPGAGLLADTTARRALESAGTDLQGRRQILKCLFAAGLLGGTAWQSVDTTLVRAAFANYRTGTGERRRWVLDDGSTLWLNTASAVNLELTADQRHVQLIEGEVALDARAASRPLQVITQHAVVYTPEANVLVRQGPRHTQVTVLRGLAHVSPQNSPVPLTLAAGWQTRIDSLGASAPRRVDLVVAQAWLRGILPAERMRLDLLLSELARYRPGILRCSEQVAGLRVTGSFQLDDIETALALIAHTLPVRIERRTRYWVTVVPA